MQTQFYKIYKFYSVYQMLYQYYAKYYLTINLKILSLALYYNWLINIITYFQNSIIKSPIGLRPTFFMINNNSINLLNSIINKNYIHNNSNTREITSKNDLILLIKVINITIVIY